MKQFNLILAIILISILTLNAQNYQTVKSNRVAFFTSDQGNIKCIRIDTIKFQTDSIFYPFKNIQKVDYDCFSPYGYSWIGKKVIIKSNGTNLFFNRYNDTIKIKTNAKINESWTAFHLKDSIKIIAQVTGIDNLTFLGQLDSVKTIGFKAYDKNMTPINPYLNKILLSKNNGLVRMMNFSLFPIAPNQSSYEILETYNLIGLSNPNIGVQNLTWLEVFDFKVGDELHILNETSDWFPGNGYLTTIKTKLKYLERLDSKDSIVYRIDREESTFKRIAKWDSTSYVFAHDTIKAVYRPDSLFDKLPGEPIVSEDRAYTHTMTYGNNISKSKPSGYDFIFPSTDVCWRQQIADGCLWRDTYLKGLGGPYFSCSSGLIGLATYENSLVYYKKGLSTWGTPLIITDVKTIENNDNIKVYPNPATDFIILENATGKTEKFVLQLMDMQGRQVLTNNIELNSFYTLDLKGLKEGAYLLKLQNGEKQISKMIIKKP